MLLPYIFASRMETWLSLRLNRIRELDPIVKLGILVKAKWNSFNLQDKQEHLFKKLRLLRLWLATTGWFKKSQPRILHRRGHRKIDPERHGVLLAAFDFNEVVRSRFSSFPSFRRKPKSSKFDGFWMPDHVRHDGVSARKLSSFETITRAGPSPQ